MNTPGIAFASCSSQEYKARQSLNWQFSTNKKWVWTVLQYILKERSLIPLWNLQLSELYKIPTFLGTADLCLTTSTHKRVPPLLGFLMSRSCFSPSWVKVTFSQPLSRPAFPILSWFSQVPTVVFFLLFQENNPLVCVTLGWPLGKHYCLQADVKIYISACLILVTEGCSQVSKLPREHLCNQWCAQRRAFSRCTGMLCWAEANSAE